jgi:hypothetical protein
VDLRAVLPNPLPNLPPIKTHGCGRGVWVEVAPGTGISSPRNGDSRVCSASSSRRPCNVARTARLEVWMSPPRARTIRHRLQGKGRGERTCSAWVIGSAIVCAARVSRSRGSQ